MFSIQLIVVNWFKNLFTRFWKKIN